MKRSKILAILLALLLLASLCACSEPAHPAQDPSKPSLSDFEACSAVSPVYRYTDSARTIEILETGLTLNLPEDWLGQVEVYRQEDGSRVMICAPNVVKAYLEMGQKLHPDDLPESSEWRFGWNDWLLYAEVADAATAELYDTLPEKYIFLGENEHGRIYCCTAESRLLVQDYDQYLLYRQTLIQEIGQEAYDALFDGLTCTEEMARQIVTIPE